MIVTTERNEQYEIWVQHGLSRWEMLASFPDREIAFDLLQNRHGRTRLICVAFEQGRMVSQDLVEESGATPLDRRRSA